MKYIPKRILQTTMLASGLLLLNACGGGGGSTSGTPDTNTSTPDATSITHNGTTYGFVTSPYTGKVWLDRNLGAARVCEQFDDSACYGDYYQWGRNFDGHEDSTSGTTGTQATNVTDVGHEDFITSNAANNRDWADNADSTGSIRTLNWSKTDGSSVCPTGFKVPSITELRAETLDNGVTDYTTAFTNFLKLSSAGYRRYSNGFISSVGSEGLVWASSVNGSGSHIVSFRSGESGWSNNDRAVGLTVRCLRD